MLAHASQGIIDMKFRPILLAAAAALVLAAPWAQASSTAGSSASSAASDTVGSVSDSFQGSSNSSSEDDKHALNGDYRVQGLYAVADRPGRLRIALVPVDQPEQPAVMLELPQQVAMNAGVVEGLVITARPRPYGTEFATAEAPFYLVVEDAWYRELVARRVTL